MGVSSLVGFPKADKLWGGLGPGGVVVGGKERPRGGRKRVSVSAALSSAEITAQRLLKVMSRGVISGESRCSHSHTAAT